MLENQTKTDKEFITTLTALIIKAKTPKQATDVAVMVNQMIGDVIDRTKESVYDELKVITDQK